MATGNEARSAARTLLCLLILIASAMVAAPLAAPPASAAVRVGTPSGIRAFQSVVDGTGRTTVVWRAATNASSYRVLLSASRTMSSPRVVKTSSRRAVFGRLRPDRSYCIRVQGVRGRTTGKASPVVCTSARAGAPWVAQQALESTSSGVRTAITLRWARVAGAGRVEVDYAISPNDKLVDVQASRSQRTVSVRVSTTSSLQTATVRGLTPGRVYCFQLRGLAAAGSGLLGARHCKMTMRTSRGVTPAAVPLAVATFNTCSSTPTCANVLGPWSERAPYARDRILAMHAGATGGRPIDVIAIQEGGNASPALVQDLDGTFTRGCVGGGSRQSVFVRDATWEVVRNSDDSMDFSQWDDGTHGACWVVIRDVVTQTEVVVVGLHLYTASDSAGDTIRAQQMDRVADTVKADHPGITIVYAGDFNSHRTRATDAPRLRLAADGHDDAYDQAALYASVPYRNSSCGKVCLNGRVPLTSVVWGDHVDRVFAPPGVRVSSWKLDHRMDGSRYAAPLLSDHNPVVVELQLRAPDAN